MERAERFGQCPDLVVVQEPVRGRRVREGEESERGEEGWEASEHKHAQTYICAYTGQKAQTFMYAHVP